MILLFFAYSHLTAQLRRIAASCLNGYSNDRHAYESSASNQPTPNRKPTRCVMLRCFLNFGIAAACILCSACQRETNVAIVPAFADLGSFAAQDAVVHDFEVMNNTSSPIVVDEVIPSCNCISLETVEGDPDEPLMPNHALTIRARMLMPGTSEIQQGAVVVRFSDAASDSPGELSTRFLVRLKADYELDAAEFKLGDLREGTTLSWSIRLASLQSGSKIQLLAAEATDSSITITDVRPDRVDFELHASAGATSRAKKAFIHITTSSVYRPHIAVPVSWRPQKLVEAKPPVLALSAETSTEKLLTVRTLFPTTLISVQMPPGCRLVKGNGEQLGSRALHRIQLLFDESWKEQAGAVKSHVTVKLQSESEESFTVRVPVVSL